MSEAELLRLYFGLAELEAVEPKEVRKLLLEFELAMVWLCSGLIAAVVEVQTMRKHSLDMPTVAFESVAAWFDLKVVRGNSADLTVAATEQLAMMQKHFESVVAAAAAAVELMEL